MTTQEKLKRISKLLKKARKLVDEAELLQREVDKEIGCVLEKKRIKEKEGRRRE